MIIFSFYEFENEFCPLLSTLFEHRRSGLLIMKSVTLILRQKESIKGVRDNLFFRVFIRGEMDRK